jgi:alkylation response protein AidB-like acyl-CoA dehydrogenase
VVGRGRGEGWGGVARGTRFGRKLLLVACAWRAALVGLSEEEAELHHLAERFAAQEMKEQAARWDEEKVLPEDVLRRAAELGFGGLFVREAHGGTGMSRLQGSVIFEALASACPSTTAYITIHNMCAWMIDSFGSEYLRSKYLADVCSMSRFASYCLTEPSAGSDAASLATSARREGEEYVLNGSKMFISGAGTSGVYVVMARTGGKGPKGISCFVVDGDSKGLEFGANERKLGWNSQPTRAVMFDNVRVPAKNLVGQEGDGFTIAMRGLDGGRISIGTCSVGGAYRCIQEARSYTRERRQFGRPLAEFQALQFRLADMATDLVTARSWVRQAARMLDAKDPNARSFAAMAKRVSTDLGFNVANQALQLHGGYGYLKDYPIERFLRDLRVHQILEGTNEIMRVIVARQLLDEAY